MIFCGLWYSASLFICTGCTQFKDGPLGYAENSDNQGSLKSPSKWINNVDNGLGSDKLRKETGTYNYANKGIYVTFILL